MKYFIHIAPENSYNENQSISIMNYRKEEQYQFSLMNYENYTEENFRINNSLIVFNSSNFYINNTNSAVSCSDYIKDVLFVKNCSLSIYSDNEEMKFNYIQTIYPNITSFVNFIDYDYSNYLRDITDTSSTYIYPNYLLNNFTYLECANKQCGFSKNLSEVNEFNFRIIPRKNCFSFITLFCQKQ